MYAEPSNRSASSLKGHCNKNLLSIILNTQCGIIDFLHSSGEAKVAPPLTHLPLVRHCIGHISVYERGINRFEDT